ncbi:MAG: hypothetical protein ACOYMD_08050 [Paludibacter sp.]
MKNLKNINKEFLSFEMINQPRKLQSLTISLIKISVGALFFINCFTMYVNGQSRKSQYHKQVNKTVVAKNELWFENVTRNSDNIKKTTLYFKIVGNKVYGESNYIEFDKDTTWMITPRGSFNGTIQNGKYIKVFEKVTNRDGSQILKEETRNFILKSNRILVEICKGKEISFIYMSGN